MTNASVQLPPVRFWFVTWMHFYFARCLTLSECVSLLWCGRWFHWGVPEHINRWQSYRESRRIVHVYELWLTCSNITSLSRVWLRWLSICPMAIVSVWYVILLLPCYVFYVQVKSQCLYLFVTVFLLKLLLYIQIPKILWRAFKSEIAGKTCHPEKRFLFLALFLSFVILHVALTFFLSFSPLSLSSWKNTKGSEGSRWSYDIIPYPP